ncbi:MAG: CBS domain-containing protein [Oribacterium sp.]|nr:CBS domain-containing protein [Oribacterium sp.]
MYADYLIDVGESIFKATWMLYRNGRILIAVKDGYFYGVITFKEINRTFVDSSLLLSDICNRSCKYIYEDGKYEKAGYIFANHPEIRDIPVLDKENKFVELLSRERVLWERYYRENRLPRMHYAYCMYNAAFEARELGYKEISVIEFGVAGGNGLLNCEFHSNEIERILGIKIKIFGFDSSEGLPIGNAGYKDMIHIWPDSSYKMDRERLEKRVCKSELVIGNFESTVPDFFEKNCPPPVGCMLIDVDRYSSTIPILNMLESDNKWFLPRVYMYFDDISPEYEFQGEALAIKEFNNKNDTMKISPEGTYGSVDYKEKIKTHHRFTHPKYNDQTRMYNGWQICETDLELPLTVSM